MSEVTQLHAPFAKFLRSRGIEFIRTRSDQRSTIECGWPDFTILAPGRTALLIEFKIGKGKESPDQVAVRERLTAKGFACHVCRDMPSACAAVDAWLGATKTTCTIRARGEHGDWIHDGAGWLRPAVIADHHHYSRQ